MEKDSDKEERVGRGGVRKEEEGRRRRRRRRRRKKGEQSQQPLISMPLRVSADISWKLFGSLGDPLESSWWRRLLGPSGLFPEALLGHPGTILKLQMAIRSETAGRRRLWGRRLGLGKGVTRSILSDLALF